MTDAPKLEPLSDGTGFRVRVRFCGTQQRFRVPIPDPDAAAERGAALVEMGRELTDSDVPTDENTRRAVAALLTKAGAASSADELGRVRAAVAKLARGGVVARPKATGGETRTVRELGESWTSGKLAERYPDQIKAKRTADEDARILERHVYPLLGNRSVASITLDDCEDVMRRLSSGGARRKKLSPLTRRNVLQTLSRLFTIAAYPLRLIAASPIPKGFVPKAGGRKALSFLYPSEDARLLACAEVSFDSRILWGFLAREGMRVAEALKLRWGDLDLDTGVVNLDRNKTDDPRAWALDAGVVRALNAYRGNGKPADLVFRSPAEPERMATMLRRHLKAAKVERAELFARSEVRLPIRVHDLRGSFVTIALANGRTEAWVTDRTGHRSSQMVARYKRAARTAEEARLGDWTPLDVALGTASPSPVSTPPETSPPGETGGETVRSQLRDLNPRPTVYETAHPQIEGSAPAETSVNSTIDQAPDRGLTPGLRGSAKPLQGAPSERDARQLDPVELALASALERASAAGEWSVVAALASELAARRSTT
jgi:integrase